MSTKRVLVALSGGVDSSVCVYLLQKMGYEVAGVVLKLSPLHQSAVEAAKRAADTLGIPLFVRQEEALFEQQVISPFCKAYQMGRTPNPCVICNPTTKFALLCETADREGFPYIATGHYAGIEEKNGRYLLKKAECIARDQSYMLYRLTQAQLSRLILPLQALSKDEVRQIAREAGLACAQAPDSQEICFIEGKGYADFVERHSGTSRPGEFIGPDGKVVGRHNGIIHYTVGQRKGLGLALGRPVFVKRISPEENRIYLGFSGEEYAGGIMVEQLCSVSLPSFDHPMQVGVKIRSMASPAPATLVPLPQGRAKVLFESPQRAPAPGQSAVFYAGDYLLGGGFITEQLL